MQVSGFKDTPQINPRNAHPVLRPSKNRNVSPRSVAVMAAKNATGALKTWAAAAEPAATSAKAAGAGSPTASAKTIRKSSK